MRSKRLKQLSEIEHARLVQQAGVLCRELNGLSARLAPGCDDYMAITSLNMAVLSTIKQVTGKPAPWIMPTTGASYPDAKGEA